jgi:hypothetical protein
MELITKSKTIKIKIVLITKSKTLKIKIVLIKKSKTLKIKIILITKSKTIKIKIVLIRIKINIIKIVWFTITLRIKIGLPHNYKPVLFQPYLAKAPSHFPPTIL